MTSRTSSRPAKRWLTSWLGRASAVKPAKSPRLNLLHLEDRTLPDGTLPVLSNLHLRTDTGASATDLVTWDPTVLGTVTNDDALAGAGVQVDLNGDGAADATGFPGADGSYEFSEAWPAPGPLSYRFRTFEWNAGTQTRVYGSWSATPFSFTYEFPPNAPPQLGPIQLSRDTGTAGDLVTFDPAITGTVTNDGDTTGLTIETDENNDGAPDGVTFAGADGAYLFTPNANKAGPVSVRVRVREWDVNRAQFLDSAWSNPFTFTLTTPPSAQVQTLGLARDTGNVGDLNTFDSTLIGTVGPSGGGLSVAFDHNNDGKPDGWAAADAQGKFQYRPAGLGYGGVTVRARYSEWNAITGSYQSGNWIPFSFTYTAVPAPTVSEFKLKNDTGLSNSDNDTQDPTVTGLVAFDDGAANREVQIDVDGNGTSDASVLTDGTGRFEYLPYDAAPGTVTISVRPVVWDGLAQTSVLGSWKALTFTLREPAVQPPTVAELKLVNDTGPSATDGKTTDPTVSGKLTDPDSAVESVAVEFDTNGDGVVDGTASTAADGSFSFRPAGLAGGAVTIRARGTEWDGNRGAWAYGDWKALSFTLESPTNTPPAVSQFKIKTDTGPNTADGKTTDPTLVGLASNPDGDSAYLAVEFDEDGDGKVDGQAFADVDGHFEYRSSTLRPGAVSVKARAVEFDPAANAYLRGDWAAASFTLELDTTGNSGVPTADGSYAGTVTSAAAVYNAAVGGGATGQQIELGIGRYEGAQGYGQANPSANAVPFTVAATTTAPAPRTVGGTISISTTGASALSASGSYSYAVAVNGTQFVIDSKISYTYTLDQTTVAGGATTTLHQTGSYSFTYHGTFTLGPNGAGGVVITNGVYDVTEATSMTSTYTIVNNYSLTSGIVVVTGVSNGTFTGTDSSTRTEHGTFSSTPTGGTAAATYTLTGSGSSSGNTSDSATYAYLDARSSGSGTVAETTTFTSNYSFTQVTNSSWSNSGASLTGTLTYDAAYATTDDLAMAGKYASNFGGISGSGAYSIKASTAQAVTAFHYVGTLSATAAGRTTAGDYQMAGNVQYSSTYADAGNTAVNQTNYSSNGTYQVSQSASGQMTSTQAMHYESSPTAMLVSGTFATSSTGTATLTNGFNSTYSGTIGPTTYSGTYANQQTSTETVVNSANTGTYTATNTDATADGTFSQTVTSSFTITYSDSGPQSRPNHTLSFTSTGTRAGTGLNQQSGKYHVDKASNTSAGTYQIDSTENATGDYSQNTSDTDVVAGTTHVRTGSSTSHSVTTDASTDSGTFAGELGNTTWTGTYSTKNTLAGTGSFTSANSYSGNGRSGTVSTTGSGTNGFTNTASGSYTRTNTTMVIDGTYANSDYQTGISHTDASGTYTVTSPGSTTTGSFTSIEDTSSTFNSTDNGTLTVRGASITRAGSFVQAQTTKRDSADTDNWSYVTTAAGRTDSGTSATTSKTHYDASLSDTGTYSEVDGKLTSSGTIADAQLTDAKTTRTNTNNYSSTSPGVSTSGTSTSSDVVDTHTKGSSTTKYTRAAGGISLAGTANDSSDVTVTQSATDAGTTSRTGTARVIIYSYNTQSTLNSHVVVSGNVSFTQGGNYGSYSGPSFPGAGRYNLVGGREESGHTDRSETIDTTGNDYAYQNSPAWEDDGSQNATGYVTTTTKSTGHVVGGESADFTNGAAGKFRSGTFNRTTDTFTRVDSASSSARTNTGRTNRGTTTAASTGWSTKTTHSAETNGKFSNDAPTGGTASFSRSAHTDFSSAMVSYALDTESANFTTWDESGPYGPLVVWTESGLETTTRNAAETVTDKSDYSYSTSKNTRSGSITRNKSANSNTTGTWFSSARLSVPSGSGASFAMYGSQTFGLFTEYGFGVGGTGMFTWGSQAPTTGSVTSSASRRENWANKGASTYSEQGTYSGTFGGGMMGMSGGGGYGGPPGGGSGSGGGSGYTPDGYTRNGTYTSTNSSSERWDVTDQDQLTFSGPGGSGNRTYTGSGRVRTEKSSDDTGSYSANNGTQTSTGVKNANDWFEDIQNGQSNYSSNYDYTVGTDHWWGSSSGNSNGNSRKSKQTTDTNAGYSQTEGTGATSPTRSGGTTLVDEHEFKTGKYSGSGNSHYTGQRLTYQSSSGSMSGGGPPQQVWVNVYSHSDASGSGTADYKYDNTMNTTYSGSKANSTYTYYERNANTSKSDNSSSSYYPDSGTHSSSGHYRSENSNTIDDSGTQDPDGSIHNGILLGVHHVDYNWSASWGVTDGIPWGNASGSPFTHEWWELSYGAQAFIDWLGQMWEEWGDTILDWTQTALDVAAIFAPPGVGAALALANAGISLARGKPVDWVDLALSVVPGVGAAAKAFKVGSKALKVIGAAERTISALGSAYNVVNGLYHGAGDLYDGAKKVLNGELAEGFGQMAGGAMSVAGAAASLKGASALAGRHSPCQSKRVFPWNTNQNTCFVAGTPIRTPDGGSKPIEQFRPGDAILTKNELRPESTCTAGVVVDAFTRVSPTLLVKVKGITIEATPEHPIWVLGFGWKPAAEVKAGDEFLTSDNRKVVCEGVERTGRVVTVYNMEVAGDHTYFVGGETWGFDVWVHNARLYHYTSQKGFNAIKGSKPFKIKSGSRPVAIGKPAGVYLTPIPPDQLKDFGIKRMGLTNAKSTHAFGIDVPDEMVKSLPGGKGAYIKYVAGDLVVDPSKVFFRGPTGI